MQAPLVLIPRFCLPGKDSALISTASSGIPRWVRSSICNPTVQHGPHCDFVVRSVYRPCASESWTLSGSFRAPVRHHRSVFAGVATRRGGSLFISVPGIDTGARIRNKVPKKRPMRTRRCQASQFPVLNWAWLQPYRSFRYTFSSELFQFEFKLESTRCPAPLLKMGHAPNVMNRPDALSQRRSQIRRYLLCLSQKN